MAWNLVKVVAVAMAVGLASVDNPADAQGQTERFGVVGVQNDTGNVTVHFQVKIGDGQWVSYTLAPGHSRVFSHEYRNQNDRTSPTVRIRFNSAIGNNPRFDIEYTLQRYAAPDRTYQYAKKYSFQKNTPNYFDLTSIN